MDFFLFLQRNVIVEAYCNVFFSFRIEEFVFSVPKESWMWGDNLILLSVLYE